MINQLEAALTFNRHVNKPSKWIYALYYSTVIDLCFRLKMCVFYVFVYYIIPYSIVISVSFFSLQWFKSLLSLVFRVDCFRLTFGQHTVQLGNEHFWFISTMKFNWKLFCCCCFCCYFEIVMKNSKSQRIFYPNKYYFFVCLFVLHSTWENEKKNGRTYTETCKMNVYSFGTSRCIHYIWF